MPHFLLSQPFHGIPNLFTAQRELYEYNRELHRQAIASQKEEDGSGKKKQPRRGSGGGKQRDKGPKVGQRVTFTPQVQVRMYDEQTQSPADTTVGEAQPSVSETVCIAPYGPVPVKYKRLVTV